MRNALFFDFDGVIHNTFDFHLSHINEHYGINLSAQEYKDMHNGTVYESDIPAITDVAWETYARAVRNEQGALVIRPDIKATLELLSRSYTLFLVTSGFRIQIEEYLKHNGIHSLFTDEQYQEDAVSKHEKFETLFARYDVTPAQSVFITDTLGDIEEAHKVNLRTIAVTFGFHARERLSEGNPYAYVDSWADMPSVVSRAFE